MQSKETTPFRMTQEEIQLIRFIRNFQIAPGKLLAMLMEKFRPESHEIAI